MIYFDGISSVLESVYLNERLGNKSSGCNVFVNPENTTYIAGKIVIINTTDYPEEKLKELLRNGCKVISRVYNDNPEVMVHPYILRVDTNIQWNGRELIGGKPKEVLENGLMDYDSGVCYFPKLPAVDKKDIVDPYGNLTIFGWALQQVGQNILPGSEFSNLDLVKTKKVVQTRLNSLYM